MIVRRKQNEKRYSLMIAPKEVIAKELGKIRQKNKVSLTKAAEYLQLTEEEVQSLEQGLFKSKYINMYLHKYMSFLNASFDNLYKHPEYKVQITNIKNGKKLGTETYWMAIDAYTTRFSNREELLDHIRLHQLADIEDIPNDDLWIFIDYPRESNQGIIDLIYNDNEELTTFINENKIAASFSPDNPYVKSFLKEIKQVFRSSPIYGNNCSAEYRIFARSHYYQYNKALVSIAQNWDKKYDEDILFGPVLRYSSIRANTLCHMAFKKSQKSIERKLKPFNEIDKDDHPEPITKEPSLPFKNISPKLEEKSHKMGKVMPGQMILALFEETKKRKPKTR